VMLSVVSTESRSLYTPVNRHFLRRSMAAGLWCIELPIRYPLPRSSLSIAAECYENHLTYDRRRVMRLSAPFHN
jgi:hypothetical protein